MREQDSRAVKTRPKRRARGPDHRLLFEMAAEQGGYFTARQARRGGLSADLIKYHVRRGRFRPVHPKSGVYRLRDFPTGADDSVDASKTVSRLWSAGSGFFPLLFFLTRQSVSPVPL